MGKTLLETGPVAHVAQIEHHGEKMILPEGMGLDAAIDLLFRRKEYMEERVTIKASFNVFPWDGAHALDLVLTEKYGWSPATATPGFFGDSPPKMESIYVGHNQRKQVPWGSFSLPGVAGLLSCDTEQEAGVWKFAISADVLRKDEATIRDIISRLEDKIRTHSIYRGKAIKIRFRSAAGKLLPMPVPTFLDTDSINPDSLIFSDDVMMAVQTNLFTPIQRVTDCLYNDLPIKRGVLLGGVFGTGKTMAAYVASRYAVDAGITFVYVPRADELPDAIAFAKQYQSPAAVIFCEDIDRAVAGERTVSMDDLLNIIDGIDSKSSNIITVLTTNAMEDINPAMLRPGRLDAVIMVTPPDAKAVERLIRLYGAGSIDADTDLREAGEALAGNIPAVIAEAVKRAKLAQLRYQPSMTKIINIGQEAIVDASKSLALQLRLLNKVAPQEMPTLQTVMTDMLQPVFEAAHSVHELTERLNDGRVIKR